MLVRDTTVPLTRHFDLKSTTLPPCTGSGIFIRGEGTGWEGPGPTEKCSDSVFLVLNLCSEGVQWFISRKTIIFRGSRVDPTFSRVDPTFSSGSNIFQGVFNC